MPYRPLVENKQSSNPDLLGIHGGMEREEEIARYLKTHDTIKIATTYDSLQVVCDTLEALGRNPYNEMFLFVDEYHTLLNSYGFRYQAVNRLLSISKRFCRKTFVSATPIEREYWMTEIADMPEYRIE